MMTLEQIHSYLRNEQTIAKVPGTPEWQVFTTLLNLANSCDSAEQFIAQAETLPIEGPSEEVTEAKQWITIALDTIKE